VQHGVRRRRRLRRGENDGSPSRDDNDNNVVIVDAGDDRRYGPAPLPRVTYELRTIPRRALHPGNYEAAGAGSIAIPDSWRWTMDDIIDEYNDDEDDRT